MNTRTSEKSESPSQSVRSSAATNDRRRRMRLDSDAAGFLLGENDVLGEGDPTEVRVNDVSRLGVGFLTHRKMDVGSICRIRIGYGPMRLARRLRVQRCESTGNIYRIGAEFA